MKEGGRVERVRENVKEVKRMIGENKIGDMNSGFE